MSAFEQPPDLHQKTFHEILTDFLENKLDVLQIYNMEEMVNFMGFFVHEVGEGTNFLNIQQEKANVIAPNQEGENTCYAYACARSIYFAAKRIVGRSEDDMPDFDSLVEVMICAYGKNGAKCYDVLKLFGEEYRLHVMTIGPPSLTDHIAQRTPVAQFTLKNEHWNNFERYANEPVITRAMLIGEAPPSSASSSSSASGSSMGEQSTIDTHAVLLLGRVFSDEYNQRIYAFLNSSGPDKHDNGVFRFTEDVIMDPNFDFQFYNVFHDMNDLTEEEKLKANEFKTQVANDLGVQFFPNKSDRIPYICPTCHQERWVGRGICELFIGMPCFECMGKSGKF